MEKGVSGRPFAIAFPRLGTVGKGLLPRHYEVEGPRPCDGNQKSSGQNRQMWNARVLMEVAGFLVSTPYGDRLAHLTATENELAAIGRCTPPGRRD